MFSRYLLGLFAIALVVAVATSTPVEEPELEFDDEVEPRNPALAIAIKILQKAFKWAAKHCLEQAANQCRQHWKNPGELIKCGGHFLQQNKGRCLIG